MRTGDVVARWGGEEFLLLLPRTKAMHLPLVAANVLQALTEHPFELPGARIAVTASLGCTGWPMHPGQSWPQALQAADRALYASKNAGRNRATCIIAQSVQVSDERLWPAL